MSLSAMARIRAWGEIISHGKLNRRCSLMLTGLARAVPPHQCVPAPSLQAEFCIAQNLGALGSGLPLALAFDRLFASVGGDSDVEAFNVELFPVSLSPFVDKKKKRKENKKKKN
jgi:hypothetical protein